MLQIILFWFLRIMSLFGILVNIIYIESNGLWGIIAVILGLISIVNLYLWGLFCRENNKSLPGLFILFRILQGVTVFLFDSMPISYYATYILVDVAFYGTLLYDSRFKFILREPREGVSEKIKREDI